MISPSLLLRLGLDAVAGGLLVFGLSYWWLGNTAHELAGCAMFLLLCAHNAFNRRFYGRIVPVRRDPASWLNVAITAALVVAMLVLFITSVMISNALPDLVPPVVGVRARQIHTLAAYWALIIVSVHLGLRWPLILHTARKLCGITHSSTMRTAALRAIAVAVAVHGIWSAGELGFGGKLAMQVAPDWWNFEESVAGFFAHVFAIAGLCITLTYYATKLIRWRR